MFYFRELELKLESYQKLLDDETVKNETQFNEVKRCKRLLVIKDESLAKIRIQQSRKLTAMRENIEQRKKYVLKINFKY